MSRASEILESMKLNEASGKVSAKPGSTKYIGAVPITLSGISVSAINSGKYEDFSKFLKNCISDAQSNFHRKSEDLTKYMKVDGLIKCKPVGIAKTSSQTVFEILHEIEFDSPATLNQLKSIASALTAQASDGAYEDLSYLGRDTIYLKSGRQTDTSWTSKWSDTVIRSSIE